MAEPASISTGIAGRYATAAFDLAREEGGLPAIEADIRTLDDALRASADLRAMISSPVHTREEQGRAVAALAGRMGLSGITTNLLGLMAAKRRLFALPQVLGALRERLREERGEVEAEVTSAQPLSPEQEERLRRSLSEGQGRAVTLRTSVDEGLIGGLVVRLGSKMIDTSIRSRLADLQGRLTEAR